MASDIKGKLITFEGSEGSGKSTQIKLLYKYLKKEGRKVLLVREPGGVKISEKIRNILLDVNHIKMSNECETLLYMAARSQLVKEVILPALQRGEIILCDRYLDSTLAYQGYGNGVDLAMIKKIGRFATQGVTPHLTVIFNIEAAKGLSRITRPKDRIEKRADSYHKKVQQGYLSIAQAEPKRVKVIEVNKSKEEIHDIVLMHVKKVLN